MAPFKFLTRLICYRYFDSNIYATVRLLSNISIQLTPTIKMPIVYNNLQAILNDLNNNKDVPGVLDLIQTYNNKKEKYAKEYKEKAKKYPLIVLEGLDGCGKSTTSKRFAKELNAEQWCTPPESIKHIRCNFDEHCLRPVYYGLGNYIAALEVSLILTEKPVIMDRYWHSTAAFAIAQAVDNNPEMRMPPEGDSIYRWPSDLLKPDVVFFLNVSEQVRIERHSRRNIEVTAQENLLKDSSNFRNNVILAYKNMYEPGLLMINADKDFVPLIHDLQTEIQHLL